MGQSNSAPVGGRRKSFRSSWRSPFPHRSRSHKGNLSATFSVLDTNTKLEQLNVNTASEEELMTLPEVSRTDAHNIVEYRQRLGRFKKVEDLALVSGIGAEKLALIRPEICVGSRRSPSCASSCAQSVDSLSIADMKPSPRIRHIPLININTASVFELQALPGLNQELAANIVDYRDTHGMFSTLDQVTKVKGINHMLLGAVRCRLTVHSDLVKTPTQNGVAYGLSVTHSTPKCSLQYFNQNTHAAINGKLPGHRKSLSVPLRSSSSAPNGLVIHDILDILSACSPRPIVEDHFDGQRNGRSCLRLASWNLSGLSLDKAANPGVKEVICRTILENRFSLIAVQDVDSLGLEQICEELNFPSLRRIKEVKENSCSWNFKTIKGLGFLWDGNSCVSLTRVKEILFINIEPRATEALLAEFVIKDFSICLINVYPPNTQQSMGEHEMIKQVEGHLLGEQKRAIIISDFSQFKAIHKDGDNSVGQFYQAVLPLNTATSALPCNQHADRPGRHNIFLNRDSFEIYAEKSGVVRQGLTHLAIPRNWSWGGPASDYCPVWCEIYTS